MSVRVRFQVQPETHLVRVTQTFPASDDAVRTFRMAAWVPGSYKIRDYGRHVQDVSCEVDGKAKTITQTGKDAWAVRAPGQAITVAYDVYCRDLSVQASHVTNDHGHLFPASLVLYDADSRGLPHQVSVDLPKGWRLCSGLETAAFDGTLEAADDYDHLIDCPIECAPTENLTVLSFNVRRRPHRFVVWMAPEGMDEKRITSDVRKVVEETAKIFGGLPYDHYTFLTHVAKDHGGGLEHRNSTTLGVDPLALLTEEKIQERLLPLVAHEFFHTWNVKRIKPEAFTPYDLQSEVYTDLLWLFEGFTTYYELPILARAGVVDEKHWGNVVTEMMKYYDMALGRKRRSVSEASRLTWSLLYQPHEHNVNRNVSYYTKGLFVGLCLDAYLRTHGVTEGLDVVMRHLWKHFGEKGVPEDAMADVVKEATGVDVARVLGRWTHGTGELPIDKALRDLGLDVKRAYSDPEKPLGLGVHFKDGNVIERVPEDGPAHKVLQAEDKIVAVAGYEWSGDRFSALANLKEEGEPVSVHVFREGRLRAFEVPLRTMPKDKISISVRKGDAVATRRRKAWLGEWKKAKKA